MNLRQMLDNHKMTYHLDFTICTVLSHSLLAFTVSNMG